MYHGDIRGRKEKMVDEALGVLKLDLKQSMWLLCIYFYDNEDLYRSDRKTGKKGKK